ncbi:uncharacterized protein LOC144744148 [Ciona intestinalis]
MSFVPRLLWARTHGFLKKPLITRGYADWIKPNFSGGPAKPHEWSKFVRQSLYTDGEKIVAFGLIGLTPIFLWYVLFHTDSYQRRRKTCHQRLNTEIYYPSVKRDES